MADTATKLEELKNAKEIMDQFVKDPNGYVGGASDVNISGPSPSLESMNGVEPVNNSV